MTIRDDVVYDSGVLRDWDGITYECVGYQDGLAEHRMWFSRWFLDHCYFEAPAVIWQRDGGIVKRTYKSDYQRPSGLPNVAPMIWRLTDERDVHGRRLGVWPD